MTDAKESSPFRTEESLPRFVKRHMLDIADSLYEARLAQNWGSVMAIEHAIRNGFDQ